MRKDDLEIIRPIWYSHSFVPDENCRQSLNVWFTDGNYVFNSSDQILSIYCQDLEEVKKSISLDAFRFSAHSAQTVFELENSHAYNKLTSWRIIQTYYAAFFAAHATLRFFGRSFSHLARGHVRFLADRCFTEVGHRPQLKSSYHEVGLCPKSQNLTFVEHSESHKGLWRCYRKLIDDVSQQSLNLRASESRRQEISQIFSDLADSITDRGKLRGGNWLSSIRNDVNYKSMEGAWYPFSKATPPFDELMRKVREWRVCKNKFERPNLIRGGLERFFVTSFVIIDFCISISLDYISLLRKPGLRSNHFSRIINSTRPTIL